MPSAVDLHINPRDEVRLIRSEEDTRGGDVLGLSQAANRHIGYELLPVFRRVGNTAELFESFQRQYTMRIPCANLLDLQACSAE